MIRQPTLAEVMRMSLLHPRFVREQRNLRIRAKRLSGQTLQAIAAEFGLTRARVQQICKADERKSTAPPEAPGHGE